MRPTRSPSVAGPAGSVVRSPKNSTSIPPPWMSRSQSRQTTSLSAQGLEHRTGRARTERHDVHAEVVAQADEPVEQLRRLEALDDDRDAVTLVGQPASGPLPAAEVGQGEDGPVALARAPSVTCENPTRSNPAATVRAESDGRRRLSIQ